MPRKKDTVVLYNELFDKKKNALLVTTEVLDHKVRAQAYRELSDIELQMAEVTELIQAENLANSERIAKRRKAA